jgi:hypothetical protein
MSCITDELHRREHLAIEIIEEGNRDEQRDDEPGSSLGRCRVAVHFAADHLLKLQTFRRAHTGVDFAAGNDKHAAPLDARHGRSWCRRLAGFAPTVDRGVVGENRFWKARDVFRWV